MSREENNRHLAQLAGQSAIKGLTGRRMRPRVFLSWLVGSWVVLLGLYFVLYAAFDTGKPPAQPAFEPPTPSQGLPASVMLAPVLAAVLMVAFILIRVRLKQRRFFRRYFESLQSPDARALAALTDEMLPANSPIPDVDALRAHDKAVAWLFYGDVDTARRELGRITWENRPPLIRALATSLEAQLSLLCTGEQARGLALAREALAQGALSPLWPGAKQSRDHFELNIQLGEILTGEVTPAAIASLEQRLQQLAYPASRLLCTWGLRVAYQRAGDTARAEQMRQLLHEQAPHCRPLQEAPAA